MLPYAGSSADAPRRRSSTASSAWASAGCQEWSDIRPIRSASLRNMSCPSSESSKRAHGSGERGCSALIWTGRHELVAVGADQQGRQAMRSGSHAMAVDRGGKAEETRGVIPERRPDAARAQIGARVGAGSGADSSMPPRNVPRIPRRCDSSAWQFRGRLRAPPRPSPLSSPSATIRRWSSRTAAAAGCGRRAAQIRRGVRCGAARFRRAPGRPFRRRKRQRW